MNKIILLFLLITLTITTINASANTVNNDNTDADCALPADTTKANTTETPQNFFLGLAKSFRLNGFTQVRYQYLENSAHPNGFDVRRARLDFKGEVTSKITYRLQLELAGTPKILDANMAYTFNNYLKVTIGQYKVPLGYENFYLDRSTIISINGSQITEALTGNSTDAAGNNNGRDIGAMISGAVKSNKKFNLIEYYAGVFNGSGVNVADNNTNKDFAGRLLIQPVKGLWVAGDYYNGRANYGTGKDLQVLRKRDRWGGELVYTNSRITFNGEFLQGIDGSTTRQGFYGQLAGYVIPKQLQLFVKYDNYDPDTNLGSNATYVTTAGVNYYFTPITRIMINYEWHGEQGTHVNNDSVIAEFQIGF